MKVIVKVPFQSSAVVKLPLIAYVPVTMPPMLPEASKSAPLTDPVMLTGTPLTVRLVPIT